MNKETHAKLMQAIQNYNETQQHEENKVDVSEVLTEIGSFDNEELETAVKKIKDSHETREQEK